MITKVVALDELTIGEFWVINTFSLSICKVKSDSHTILRAAKEQSNNMIKPYLLERGNLQLFELLQ